MPGVIPPTAVPTYDANCPACARWSAPLEKPPHVTVNGLAESAFLIAAPDVKRHAREIFARGQQMGRNPQGILGCGR